MSIAGVSIDGNFILNGVAKTCPYTNMVYNCGNRCALFYADSRKLSNDENFMHIKTCKFMYINDNMTYKKTPISTKIEIDKAGNFILDGVDRYCPFQNMNNRCNIECSLFTNLISTTEDGEERVYITVCEARYGDIVDNYKNNYKWDDGK